MNESSNVSFTETYYREVNQRVNEWAEERVNPWQGQFGKRQIFEISFLFGVSVFGTLGNLILIFSIILEKKVYSHGNIFIINLAIADIMVTGFVIPTVIANVVHTENAVSDEVCTVVGLIVCLSCGGSIWSMCFIALSRYWKVVRPHSVRRVFSSRNSHLMAVFTYLWTFLIVSPSLFGWGGIGYDEKMMLCTWDNRKNIGFTIFLCMFGLFLPILMVAGSYWSLFRKVQKVRSRAKTKLSKQNGISLIYQKSKTTDKRERALLRTLLVTFLVFVLCWLPYGVCVTILLRKTPALVKKIVTWIGLSNSCVNFVIYGIMNPVHRKGYKRLFLFICKRKFNRRKSKWYKSSQLNIQRFVIKLSDLD